VPQATLAAVRAAVPSAILASPYGRAALASDEPPAQPFVPPPTRQEKAIVHAEEHRQQRRVHSDRRVAWARALLHRFRFGA
jgi:hypothetical protein